MIWIYCSKKPYFCSLEFNGCFHSRSRICPASCSSCVCISRIIAPTSFKFKFAICILYNTKTFRDSISKCKICRRTVYTNFADDWRFMLCFFRSLNCNPNLICFYWVLSTKSLAPTVFPLSKSFHPSDPFLYSTLNSLILWPN